MYRRFVVLCLVIAGILGMQAPTVTHAQGNSDAAHACQQGGYLNLQGSDGTTFKNAGQCVSYVARGGTIQGLSSCTVSPTSGCVTLNNLSINRIGGGGTITLSGAYSFYTLTGCGAHTYDTIPCGSAVGGGTYTVSGDNFNGGTSGTFTVNGPMTSASFLDFTGTDTTCSAVTDTGQRVVVVPATFIDSANSQQTTLDLISVQIGSPLNEAGVAPDLTFTSGYFQAFDVPINATISC